MQAVWGSLRARQYKQTQALLLINPNVVCVHVWNWEKDTRSEHPEVLRSLLAWQHAEQTTGGGCAGGGQELVDCSISVKIEISVNSEHLGLLADWPINENEPAVICWDWNQREKRQIASECVCACLNACTHLCVCLVGGARSSRCVSGSKYESDRLRESSGTSYYAGGFIHLFPSVRLLCGVAAVDTHAFSSWENKHNAVSIE